VQPQVQTTVVAVLLFSLRSWRKAQGELGTSWENMGKNMGQSWEDGELQTEKTEWIDWVSRVTKKTGWIQQ
jgi:hypothetical protein